MLDKKHRLKGAILTGTLSIIILLVAAWLAMNRQYAMDQVSVWSYTPSASIAKIDQRVEFTPKGQFYFYATQPEVDGSDKFNQDCPRQEVGNPILGCYTSGRIFVYDITDSQLDGIEEVTAAHEMLHAVWERLSQSEQSRIGALLTAEYRTQVDNKDLIERMGYYQRTEPGQFENELNSILGTEAATLSPELEAYYGQYFKSRQTVVSLHAKYDTVLRSLRDRSDVLYTELTALGVSINAKTAEFNSNVAALSVDIEVFNTRAKNGAFTSINQFNTQRAALITRSNEIDAARSVISVDIESYNQKYTEYQGIASQIELLNKSIDSFKDLQPTPSV